MSESVRVQRTLINATEVPFQVGRVTLEPHGSVRATLRELLPGEEARADHIDVTETLDDGAVVRYELSAVPFYRDDLRIIVPLAYYLKWPTSPTNFLLAVRNERGAYDFKTPEEAFGPGWVRAPLIKEDNE